MQIERKEIIKRLNAQIQVNGHIIGVAAGSGMTTKCSVLGGADLILALSAGRFRQTGRASLASYLCYSNSNWVVMDFASRELMPLMPKTPILFGINATDPNINLENYITQIKNAGFDGINNWPTIGLIDGQFREALEEEGLSYSLEIEAIKLAHKQDMFTLAFVFDVVQAEQMLEAGADVICVHLGLTAGGILGAKKVQSLDRSRVLAQQVFDVCDRINPSVVKMVYGGPIKSPLDAKYIYDNTECQGFIGGSSFERIPAEKAIINTTKSFKYSENTKEEDSLIKALAGQAYDYDYVEFIKDYIKNNYGKPICLSELALATHISIPYLSAKFKKTVGCSFTEYLIRYRMNKACEFLKEKGTPVSKIAELVGYPDYIQFSKIFKKYKKMTPTAYRASVDTKN
ncbi:phosphoenolpyruvate hydrolase family protein [Caproiciproducens galactitolivorans]|uniref:phosphoenolpyruvate hydrolase family protein n=1 Tax=Caproiciproducens galactitolivorans TaxID=642589 RepID=UPI00240A48B6|nr:phosphoenolpyruvate hydrolase family protein [Caproiciproducens galactitolivorans]